MSHKGFRWSVLIAVMGWASLIVPASAQHFKQMKGTLAQVVAGRNEVFGIDASSGVWRANAAKTAFVQITGASLVQVAVGGGTGAQLDDVWGINSSQNIFHFDYKTKEFVETGGFLLQIAVGEGVQDNCHPCETWGVNSFEEVFRYDYCTNQFLHIVGIALSQVATGGGDVWALDGFGGIWRFNFDTQTFVQVPGTLAQIAVGVNDVWGLNGSNQIFHYDLNGGEFNQVGGSLTLAQIAVGGDGVWGVGSDARIYRFDPSIDNFVHLGGILTNITAGFGAGVFGVNPLDNPINDVFTFVRPLARGNPTSGEQGNPDRGTVTV